MSITRLNRTFQSFLLLIASVIFIAAADYSEQGDMPSLASVFVILSVMASVVAMAGFVARSSAGVIGEKN